MKTALFDYRLSLSMIPAMSMLVVCTLLALPLPVYGASIVITSGGPGVTEEFVIGTDVGSVSRVGPTNTLWDGQLAGPGWELKWQVIMDSERSLIANLDFKNDTAETGTFSVLVTSEMSRTFRAGSEMFGTSWISLNGPRPYDGPGTLTAPTGGAMYRALINGEVQRELFPDPTTLPMIWGFFDGARFDDERTTTPLTDNIAIQFNFTVTPGDRAQTISSISVLPTPVPEPQGLALAVLGTFGVGLTIRRHWFAHRP